MNGESCSTLSTDATLTVPLVHSTRRHDGSRLCASLGMAIAYARGDESGNRYRDLLELCLRDQPVSLDAVIAMARRLFPDVPVSHYEGDVMSVDDAVALARLGAQRDGRVLPVLVFDDRFQPDTACAGMSSIVLSTFSPNDASHRSFWDPEPPQVGGWRMSSRVEVVPGGFDCLVFGWLPPPLARGSQRVPKLTR